MSTRAVTVALLALALILSAPAAAGELSAVSDVHSRFSGSEHTIEELALAAESKGIGILILTDHARVAMSYGLLPFRHLLRVKKERPSVQLIGPARYLKGVSEVNERVKRVLVVPGLKAAPYYYWRGSYLKGDLTAHDYNRQLIVLGLDDPAEIEGLPVINGSPTKAHLKERLVSSSIFLVPLAVGLYLLASGGRLRWAGLFVAVLSVMAILNERPLSPVEADPYTQGPTLAPHQKLIDYVEGLGGLTFWVMPTSRALHKLGPATLVTEPHEDDLVETRGYTGFEALYGDVLKLHLAGSAWDRVLGEFLRGARERPTFAISGSDFWREGKSKLGFDQYQTIFIRGERSLDAVFADLKRGRVYARRRGDDGVFPRLVRFTVEDPGSKSFALSGETLVASGAPVVSVELASQPARGAEVTLTVVREGRVIMRDAGKTPLKLSFEDSDVKRTGPTYYRFYAKGPRGMFVVSNPIFVRFI